MKPTTNTNRDEQLSRQPKHTGGQWYVGRTIVHDEDTGLFTKRIKVENLKMDKDRTIAHVDGVTQEEAEANADIIAKSVNKFDLLRDAIGSLLKEAQSPNGLDETKITQTTLLRLRSVFNSTE